MRALSDVKLLEAYRLRGDQDAFAELVKRFWDMVKRAACSVFGESNAAEDIAQATFATLARKAAALDDKRSLSGWLHNVAVSLARVDLGCISKGFMFHLSPVLHQGDERLETPARQTLMTPQPGRIWAWGCNQSGQLGDGTTVTRFAPVHVKTADGAPLTAVIAVVADSNYTLVIVAERRK